MEMKGGGEGSKRGGRKNGTGGYVTAELPGVPALSASGRGTVVFSGEQAQARNLTVRSTPPAGDTCLTVHGRSNRVNRYTWNRTEGRRLDCISPRDFAWQKLKLHVVEVRSK